MLKVLLFSRYGTKGASSRVRYLQYMKFFSAAGWHVDVRALFHNEYLEALYNGADRGSYVLRGYLARLMDLWRVRDYDVLVIEKEIFPFMPAWFEWFLSVLGVPYVVDYDDALFHRYDCHRRAFVRGILGKKIDAVMRNASAVVAGNEYIAERAFSAGAQRVEIIPTVIDLERYGPVLRPVNQPLVVGWIGTPKTSSYLCKILPTLDSIHRSMPVRFLAVGADPLDFAGTIIEAVPWSEEFEVELIRQFDVGIMPLDDSPWERGKCGYKLIQYMGCGIPVVASPVGVNSKIVVHGENGLLAGSMEEWEKALRQLLEGPSSVRAEMGMKGRKMVESWYSLQVQAPRLMNVINAVVKQ